LTQQEDTFAQSANQNFIDGSFRLGSPSDSDIITKLYGNAPNSSAYNQHWNANCPTTVGSYTFQTLSPATFSPTNITSPNTIYRLQPGTYTAPSTININAPCVAIL
jgi:hypothetical protein